MIAFVPLDESHIALMHKWLNEGEALQWYAREVKSEEAVRQTYLIDKPRTGTHCHIIQYDEEPIGYLQYYRIGDYPEYCSLIGAGPCDYGLDLFIGQDGCIGRGLGARAVSAALDELVFRQADAERCLLGPAPDNRRAIRCYEKCGFQYLRTVVSEDGEEYIMALERPLHAPTPPRDAHS